MAKPEKHTDKSHDEDEHGHKHDEAFEPLDEQTHRELALLHQEASSAILFAKNIQWRSVGASLLVFAAMIFIAVMTHADRKFVDMMSLISILLTCGVIFVLVMYQFWQFNEINRIREIERRFSPLYRHICHIKSRREANVHRYTLLVFMVLVVILGSIVANVGMAQISIGQVH